MAEVLIVDLQRGKNPCKCLSGHQKQQRNWPKLKAFSLNLTNLEETRDILKQVNLWRNLLFLEFQPVRMDPPKEQSDNFQ
ncbi:hypothetical protein BCY86_03595 [Pajaroellobacter abortibovis]|uniref:Uncharacterized protein n=1 Tax=Pajaroellobacter abortibovis TaxID=1882918 RepID=A0A1L6MWF4_9BACT|nr:hypothetical protein BCY86_03595 [Pajaroellobacter abortibovis]